MSSFDLNKMDAEIEEGTPLETENAASAGSASTSTPASRENGVNTTAPDPRNREYEFNFVPPTGGVLERMIASAAAKRTKNQLPQGKLEQLYDNNGPAAPAAMLEEEMIVSAAEQRAKERQTRGRLEQIHDEDGPAPPAAMLTDTITASSAEKHAKKRQPRGTLEQILDEDGPSPPAAMMAGAIPSLESYKKKPEQMAPPTSHAMFVSALGDHSDEKKAAASTSPDQATAAGVSLGSGGVVTNRDTLCIPTREIEGEAEPVLTRPRPKMNNNSEPAAAQTRTVGNEVGTNPRPTLEPHHQSTQLIPEAFLVEERDEEVFIATPTLPWWKQKKTRLLLFAVFVIVVPLAISLGIILSRDNEQPTLEPTPYPTSPPSVSLVPSSSPSTCSYTISENMQPIDFQLDKPYEPKVAVDGNNMVVVVDDERSTTTYVIFYSLAEGDGKWVIKNAFRMGAYSTGWNSVALAGKTALVGLANDSILSVYDLNEFGFWEPVETPFVGAKDRYFFGWTVGVDEDLICVGAAYSVHIYRREGAQWTLIEKVDVGYTGNECAIAGDIIAIYDESDESPYVGYVKVFKYDRDIDGIVPLQDPILADGDGTLTLSRDHLVFTDNSGTFIYKQQGSNETFSLIQRLDPTYWRHVGGGYSQAGRQIALDNDLLAFWGESDYIEIFSEKNGTWEQTLIVEQPYKNSTRALGYYHISGRNLMATWGNDVYAFKIEDCAPTPTQVPSVSVQPTVCYPLEVAIVYDMTPHQTSWDLRKIGERGDDEILFGYSGHDDQKVTLTPRIDQMCLQEGVYEFTIYDTYDNGRTGGVVGFAQRAYYNLTSEGHLIVHGGDFESFRESKRFQLPITSPAPTSSQAPSSSFVPSGSPSLSISPTETCHLLDVNIFFGDYPEYVYWTLVMPNPYNNSYSHNDFNISKLR